MRKIVRLVRYILTVLTFPLLRLVHQFVIEGIKSQAAMRYVLLIDAIRKIFLVIVVLSLFVGVFIGGIILIHVGFFLYLMENVTRNVFILMLCMVGGFYVGISLLSLWIGCSEKIWMKCAKYEKIFHKNRS